MASPKFLKKIAIVGANGNVGSYILSALRAKGHFQITAISRIQSKATFPSDIGVARVNYEQPETLVEALKGQDALIITMSFSAQNAQEQLIRAAAEAGVPWILPNEFGMFNTQAIENETIGPAKQKDRALIESLRVSSWIGMIGGFWYEYSISGGQFGIDLSKREVVYLDDGNQRLNTSTWPQTGLAVANLLSLPISSSDGKGPTLDQYRNRMLHFSSFTLSQREMFEAVQKATGTTEKDWKMSSQSAKECLARAKERLMAGDFSALSTALYTRYFIDDAGLYEKVHGLNNEELSLPKEDLVDATKRAVELAKTGFWDKLYK
ncbi:hypothetical protein yc1106_00337 [Curvularia clavata]|uniref:NAD(P)-binding domain-containing protein n=1 Tax=Curvularia clavata TaxID=95742 RepID=A0A9Q8Z2B3_CURCL|nr:hypothetical protein yc1106_00337 [Curvularia clavata]